VRTRLVVELILRHAGDQRRHAPATLLYPVRELFAQLGVVLGLDHHLDAGHPERPVLRDRIDDSPPEADQGVLVRDARPGQREAELVAPVPPWRSASRAVISASVEP
jgi:hypothetical protein